MSSLSGYGIIFFFIGAVVGFYISVPLHELGHLVCGRLSGFSFLSFQLINWVWSKDESGSIKLAKGARLRGILGQCLMEPCKDERNFHFVLYNLGGGLVNIITGVMLLVPFFFVHNDFVRSILWGMGAISIILGAVNLIPLREAAMQNDGTNIKEASKSDRAKHGFYMMFKVNADLSKGKRIQDFARDDFVVDEGVDLSNYFVAQIVMFRSSQLEESGAYGQSYNELLRLDTEKLPPLYSAQVTLALMYHELIHFSAEISKQRARARIGAKAEDKVFQKFLRMKHPGLMPYQATKIAFLDGDKVKAQELITQTRDLMSSLRNPGMEYSVTLMLENLESRMREE